jgi:hypothetical protein
MGRRRRRIDPPCPWCGRVFIGKRGVYLVSDRPKVGDLSLCSGCRNVSVFLPDMTLRKAAPKETFDLMMDEKAATIINAGFIEEG